MSLDWEIVRETAKDMVSGRMSNEEKEKLRERYVKSIEKIDPDISNFTGLEIEKSLDSILILDPYDWIDITIENYKQIFESNKIKVSLSWSDRKILSQLIGQQVAYMSTKVLGQYDPYFFGKGKIGQMYFLHPNIEKTAMELRVGIDDFIDWIAIHERTHQYEFDNKKSSWLKDYINKKIQEAIKMDINNRRFSFFSRFDDPNLIARSDLQATMCLMEGFSDYVMNKLAPKFIFSHSQIKEKFEKKRSEKGDILQLKRQQYIIGEKFVNEVVDSKGMKFLIKAFEVPENLPSYCEINEPRLWIERMKKNFWY
ncbi:MAG: zinc-dependent metalloprotease [Candidatus Parvarchaeota archaeon]|nr:zinc-dependent metalloprotease [Candidatus Jingweiarchaeum tengchongense]MCW1298249.1 zinc-dependent metalloprotease [Candidatus Jingweiarchaeum tengchongense]MCW1300046.1 zinc-dependent metalloprotease [Candidatus Jingweiarchaeum tengchongense]MCW1304815.1 zinc-dependent metalloprotease [Candidatus Jingweiarchaeum tengchongense]MCW1305405.1 zinc-dependent metalloprotease [Candidatus Jingweiarchaeum tengchongense]